MANPCVRELRNGSYFSVEDSLFGEPQINYYIKASTCCVELTTGYMRKFKPETVVREYWKDYRAFYDFIAQQKKLSDVKFGNYGD